MRIVSNLLTVLFLTISAVSFSQENIDYLLLNKEYDKALQQIEQQIGNQTKEELYFKKGLIFNQMQKYRKAIDAFSSAKKMSPENSEILEELADAHSLLGNYYDARGNYEKAVGPDSTNLQLLGKLGRN